MIASRPLKRALKLLLICTMLALIPLRGFAAVTVGICASGDPAWNQAQPEHAHGSLEHAAAPDAQDEGNNHDCTACVEHCAGASFVAQALLASAAHVGDAERALPGERFAAGHVPEHLDPPPLAL